MAAKEASKKFNVQALSRIFTYARRYNSVFTSSLLLAVVLSVLAPVRPYLVQLSIDKYAKHNATQQMVTMFTWLFIIQIGLLLLETACRFVFAFTSAKIGQLVVKDLRKEVFHKITSYNLKQFDNTPIGTLTTRTVNDVEAVNDIFADGFIPILADLLSIICVLVYMLYTDWRTALICLTPFPILIVATYFFKESVNKSFNTVRNAVSALNAFVQEHLTGIFVTQAFAAEEREHKKFEAINKVHKDANIKAIFAYSVFFPVVEIILALSIGILVWHVSGKQGNPGLIMSFLLCLNAIFRPLRMIADKFNVLQMGVIASERIFNVLDNNDVLQNNGIINNEHIKGDIRFDNVSFSYIENQPILKNVSFHIEPGKTLAIVGNTGSGKTTITSLLNRMYQHQEGSILIDNVKVEDYDVNCLRKSIGVVLQDVFLFSGTIFENVTLSNPNISLAKVQEAAKLIGIHDFIMQLPNQYNYNVMERGATLSLGQRQLLSFLRALLYNPAILILDEATSSIDSESEQLIQAAIDKLVANRTSIIIAHRLSTIRKASQILVLDKGEVKEFGTHETLLKANKHYASLYYMQFQKREVAQSTS
jgi:ATP-binding cassette, subfamily B, multidrug efflux pump